MRKRISMYEMQKAGVIRQYDLGSPAVKSGLTLVYILCIIIAVAAMFPAVWVFLASFKDLKEFTRQPTLLPETYDIQKFVNTFEKFDLGRHYINSLISVAGSAVCAVLFNGLTAFGISVLRPRGYKIIRALIMWSLLIPATASIVPLFLNISNLGLRGSFLPLWLCMGANAFYVVLFKQFFDTFPVSLVEAARLDGCSDLQIFLRIVMPMSKGIVAVVIIYAINAAWSDFLLPYLVLNQSGNETIMVRLFLMRDGRTTDVDVLRAVALAIIPPIVLFLFCSRIITRSVMQGGIKE
jgi:multiple sugar transport system permease protein